MALVTFCLFADVQYADIEDAWNYTRTSRRYYRNTRECLRATIAHCQQEAEQNANFRFIVNLGDLIDGKNAPHASQTALDTILKEFEGIDQSNFEIHHCIGNHELYNFHRELLHQVFPFPEVAKGSTYYDYVVDGVSGTRFVVLDTHGESILSAKHGSSEQNELIMSLRTKNPNEDLNSSLNLQGVDRRFVKYNGAIDPVQLEWLSQVLHKSEQCNEKVIIFSHVPIHPDSSNHAALLWNYDELLTLFTSSRAPVAVFSGHNHANGYAQDSSGTHYIVLDAILECEPGQNAYANVHLFQDRLEIQGYGKIPSRTLVFPSTS